MDRPALEARLALLPVAQYAFFPTQALIFSERVRAVCEADCPRYGKSWSCPPAVGSVAACKERCLAYDEGLVIVTLAEVADSADAAQGLTTLPAHEEVTRAVAAILREQGCSVLTLGASSCAICGECTYPAVPCRRLAQMSPCVEGFGIVVSALAEQCGLETDYGGNVLPWFSLFLYEA